MLSSACNVNESVTKSIAAVEKSALLVQLLQLGEISIANCSGYFQSVGLDHDRGGDLELGFGVSDNFFNMETIVLKDRKSILGRALDFWAVINDRTSELYSLSGWVEQREFRHGHHGSDSLCLLHGGVVRVCFRVFDYYFNEHLEVESSLPASPRAFVHLLNEASTSPSVFGGMLAERSSRWLRQCVLSEFQSPSSPLINTRDVAWALRAWLEIWRNNST